MKFVAAFAVLALASLALAAPSAVKDEFKDLIVDFLTFAKQQLSAHDPMTFLPIKGQKIKTQDLDLTMDQEDTRLSKLSTFTVEDVTTDPDTLTATVKLNFPEVLENYVFYVSGEAFGKNVSGWGSTSISAKGLEQSWTVTLVNPDTSVQISKLDMDYKLDSLKIIERYILILGMSEEEFNKLVSPALENYILRKNAELGAHIVKHLPESFNRDLAGKNLSEVAAYIKSLIHH